MSMPSQDDARRGGHSVPGDNLALTDGFGAAPYKEAIPAGSWYALGVVLVVAVYAVMDRQVFTLLNEPVRAELGLSDTQIGILQGAGLALLSVATTYPISWLADRFDRRVVLAGCITLWSLAIVLSGLAPTFTWLLAGASIVGIGEAGISPIAQAMLPDLFPAGRLQFANSVFAIGARLSGSLGILLAGYLIGFAGFMRAYVPSSLAALSDWRLAFLTAALFLPVAMVLVLSMPRRASGMASRSKPGGASPALPLAPFLRRYAVPQFSVFLGIAAATFGFLSIDVWIPVAAARYFGQTPQQGGEWLAAIGLAAVVVGFAAGTPLIRWLETRFGTRTPLVVMTWLLLGCIPLSVAIGFATSLEFLYGALGVQMALLMVMNMVYPTMLQRMSPQHVRARIFALVTIFALVAQSLSPLAVGAVSDALGSAARPLLTAMMLVSIASLVVGGAVFWRTIKPYGRMVDEVALEDAAEMPAP